MAVLLDFVWLIAGLVALYFGAEWLVSGAAKLAGRFGISPLVIGLTVVAFGTSAPELFVSIGFNLGGQPDMSLGNVIGSNICNIGMVLGISAFICLLGVKRELVTREMPVLIIATLVFSAFLLIEGQISRLAGGLLFFGVIAYTWFQLAVTRRSRNSELASEIEAEFDLETAKATPIWKMVVAILAGLVTLYFGAEWLERGGVSLAQRIGVPPAVISLTLIAFSTSVPELATSIVASLKKEGDIITGNIVGSCLFNLLCVTGATALIKPIESAEIEPADLAVMGALTGLLLIIMLTGKKISRWEGAFLLLCYAGYCTFLWFDRVAA